MTLENKINLEEGRLKRFLNKVKGKVAPYLLASAMALTAAPGCNGGGGGGGGGGGTPPGNTAPTITTAAITSVLQGNTYQYDVDATDPDVGDTLTYSLISPPLGMGINTSNGFITWINASPSGTYNFSVQVDDGNGGTDTQNIALNVTAAYNVTVNTDDVDGNGISNLEVKLSSPTKGTYTVSSTTGSATTTVTNVPDGNDYTLSISDTVTPFVNHYTYVEPNVVVSGNTILNNPFMFKMSTPASSNVAYRNSQNNGSWLQLFKEMTRTRSGDTPSGGPHPSVSWGATNYPVNVFFNSAAAPTADTLDASLNAGSNGVPDVIDAARVAMGNINTAAGMTLLQETGSTATSNIIRFTWPATISGGLSGLTTYTNFNTNGTFDLIDIQIKNNLTIPSTRFTIEHELATHAFDNGKGAHTADGVYLRGSPSTASGITSDEGKVLKYNARLPHGTNIDLYKDQ